MIDEQRWIKKHQKHLNHSSDGLRREQTETYGNVEELLSEETSLLYERNAGDDNGKDRFSRMSMRVKQRIPYYVPILNWLPRLTKEVILMDVFAGISVGVMLVPQCLAYGLLAGLPATSGLYSAFVPILIYGIMGHSRQLSMGPDALVSILTGTTLGQVSRSLSIERNVNNMIMLASILSFLVGVFTLSLGLLRFGFLSEVLSKPLIRGFVTAIACILIVEQLDGLLGLNLADVHSWHKLPIVLNRTDKIVWLAVGMAMGCLTVLILFMVLKSRFPDDGKRTWVKIVHRTPAILIVVVIAIVLTWSLQLDKQGLPVLGPATAGLPIPLFPAIYKLSYVSALVQPAIVISIVGFVETMSVAKNYASKHGYQVSANRELVALGMANLFGSFFRAYPVFGSFARTSVADRSGARTQLAGLVASIVILLTLLLLMPLFYYLPKSAMASIVTVAAIGLFELHEIIFLSMVRAWKDLIFLFLTCIFTFIFDVEIGLMLSIGASVFMVIKHTSIPRVSVLGRIPNSTRFKDMLVYPEAQPVESILILKVEESLHFANIGQLQEMFYRVEHLGALHAHPSGHGQTQVNRTTAVVFYMRDIPSIDASALSAIRDMIVSYQKRGVRVCFVKMGDAHKSAFLKAGIIQLIGPENLFNSNMSAVDALQTNGVAISTYAIEVS